MVDGGGDFLGGTGALDADGVDDDVEVGEPASDDVEEVADGGAGGGGDEADAAGEGRERFFAGGVEEAFGSELVLELLEGELERAESFGEELGDDELVLAAFFVHADFAEREDCEAVGEV